MSKMKNKDRWRIIFFPLIAIMLVFSTVSPTLVVAAGETITTVTLDKKYTTAADINQQGFILKLKLENGKEWATDILTNAEKKQILLNAIIADQDKEQWEKLKKDITVQENPTDRTELILTLPSGKDYKVTQNQNITININPVLIENWPGEVTPVNFTIFAEPQITLGGSITKDTVLNNIQKGGKVVELQLLNAKWDEEYITTITNFNTLLDSFTNSGAGVWDAAQALKNTDPNKTVSYSNDKRTLLLKLPALNSSYAGIVKVQVPKLFYKVENVNSEGIISETGTEITGDKISGTPVMFTIKQDATPTMNIEGTLLEKDIKDTIVSPKLTFKLENAKWALSSVEKKMLLLDSIQANDQKDQWQLIKNKLSSTNIDSTTNDSEVTINFPTVEDLHLIKDMHLSINIPYQLLQNDVKIPVQQFSIKAQPKVLLSGTAMPVMTQTDFAKGGKTIVLSLVNNTWQHDVATNTTKRENLLKAFTWYTSEAEVLARADVKRTNNYTVTIKLPAVSDKFSGKILFKSQELTGKSLLVADQYFLSKEDSIEVEPVNNQSAVITGTATSKINDLDVARGGQTVIISLKNDSWKSNIESINATKPIVLSTSNNKEIKYKITRTSDTTATLKLYNNDAFILTEDQHVNITIPTELLNVRASGPLQIDSAFKVAAVTASLSGTGMNLEPEDIQRGSKTLVVTLNNAEFKDNLSVAELKTMFSSASLPWNFTTSDYSVAKNRLTIKLPAVPTYSTENGQSFTLNFKNTMLKNYESSSPVKTKDVQNGTVSIGGIASASLGQTSFAESDVQAGNRSITMTLTNAEWDATIETNASKKAALLKGFVVTDQTKEWAIASSAIAKDGKFIVNGKTLVIHLPKIPSYSIVRDQKIAVTVPKSVLSNYKYDIKVNQSLLISVPAIQSEQSFADILDSGLADYIDQVGIGNIRIEVPKKVIQKIFTYAAQLGNNTLTTVEVEADAFAKKAVATIHSADGEVTKESEVRMNDKFTFVFDDVQPNSTLEIVVYDDSDTVIDSSFNKMVAGNKIFSDLPASPLEGSYSLYSLLTEQSLLSNILKYYSLEDLKIGTTN
ncbi:hypothetical protein CSV78_04470 [Sporosarcina sp. P16a]|uniref:hypothetical protein n=1 Tax=unclassified Sporosarcina TaxID=2647733 RepID=UPI000C17187F|nr:MULTISPECIES: hypothetical protein [unclassified Sporosarcina]PIC68051.1 hypothetical protein CSV78_04470 [Sporosarcina sp. P16a]PIC94360.1 hypothetical protein CSV70_01110 [Sporosarcina sp. P25]